MKKNRKDLLTDFTTGIKETDYEAKFYKQKCITISCK